MHRMAVLAAFSAAFFLLPGCTAGDRVPMEKRPNALKYPNAAGIEFDLGRKDVHIDLDDYEVGWWHFLDVCDIPFGKHTITLTHSEWLYPSCAEVFLSPEHPWVTVQLSHTLMRLDPTAVVISGPWFVTRDQAPAGG